MQSRCEIGESEIGDIGVRLYWHKQQYADTIVPVTGKSTDGLYNELSEISQKWSDHGVQSVTRVGDSFAGAQLPWRYTLGMPMREI